MKKLQLESLNRLSLEDYKQTAKIPLVVVLDNIRSMHNVGAFFRTADAFKIAQIYLCGITPRPPHREIHKTALGATDSVDWQYFSTTLAAVNALKAENFHILALEQTDASKPIEEVKPTKNRPLALIFGNEVSGVSDEVLPKVDEAVEIPQFGTKHSLNVSVSGGIAIWHFAQPLLD